jgi:hypothetical protein
VSYTQTTLKSTSKLSGDGSQAELEDEVQEKSKSTPAGKLINHAESTGLLSQGNIAARSPDSHIPPTEAATRSLVMAVITC